MNPSWIGYSWTTARPLVAPRIVSAQYLERPPWGVSGRIVHKLWVLDYSRSDCGRVRVGSTRASWWPRRSRVAHLYPPGTPYWEDTSHVRGLVREAYVIFAGGDEAGLGSLISRGRRFARIADLAGLLDRPLYDMALAGQTLGEAGFWRGQVALASALDLLAAAEPRADGTFLLSAASARAGAARGLVDEVHDYFRAHLAEKVTLASAARHLGMSESALSHRYAAEAGRPPMAALAALRIELAKSLLLRGLKMEAVARQTGFFDAFHFSKAFKKHSGASPSEFRRAFGRPAERGP
jgi:AraC-like DNA-binding protein